MLNSIDKNWYVIYTLSRHEKQVNQLLDRTRIESYLPMYTEIRQWSDRKKKVVLPLFPNYLFVCISSKDFWKVLKIDGVIKFVSDGVNPDTISNTIIQSIQKMVSGKVEVGNLQRIKKGEKVRVTSGPFLGLEGDFVRYGSKKLLTVNVDILNRSVMLEINPDHIAKC